MTARPSALRAAREARGWSQSTAARALADLSRTHGAAVASPTSLKTQLSRWENGHATPEEPYRTLLAELYPGWQPPAVAAAPADRLRARVATAAAVDDEVVALWHGQLATAQQLADRLGAVGAVGAVSALVEQLEAVLPHLPDAHRHRPVATLLARACLLAGAHALDAGDPDAAHARFTRAAEAARAVAAPDLVAQAATGRAAALRAVGATREAQAELHHAGVDVAHPPSGLAVELAAQPSAGSADPSSASAAR